jgi:pyrimidine-nucleoside phosphorylase
VSIGTAAGLRTEAFMTRMDTPLGRAVGNSVEIAECIEVLSGTGPADLSALIVRLASRMVLLGGKASSEEDAASKVRAALRSGAARDKLREMIKWQGGDAAIVDDVTRLPSARHHDHVTAPRAGYVTALDALLVGRTAVALGAGRDKKSDPVDLSAGILLHKKPGDAVTAGEPVMELRYNDESRLAAAKQLAAQAVVIGETPPAEAPLVMGWVHDSGEQMFVDGF